jgi:RNA polymerase-binding transcription factor DksA
VATIDKDEVARRLSERADEIAQRRAQVKAATDGMREGELADYDQHPADQGTETLEQEMDETTLIILDAEAEQVELAQQKLADGSYGICVDGGEEIEPARLEVMPEAIRCMEHQRRYEAEFRARGGPPLDAS